MTQPIALMTSASGGGSHVPAPAGDKSRPQLEKAALKLYDPTPASGGGGAPGGERGAIPFQFNPKELSLTKSASWKRNSAKGAKSAGPPE